MFLKKKTTVFIFLLFKRKNLPWLEIRPVTNDVHRQALAGPFGFGAYRPHCNVFKSSLKWM